MFYFNPGDLRTKIRIQKPVITGTGSFTTTSWVDLGNLLATDAPKYIMASWVDHINGTLTTIGDSTQSIDSGTLTIRYKSTVTSKCRVIKDGIIYQLLAPPVDPTQHRQWMQLQVKAALNG